MTHLLETLKRYLTKYFLRRRETRGSRGVFFQTKRSSGRAFEIPENVPLDSHLICDPDGGVVVKEHHFGFLEENENFAKAYEVVKDSGIRREPVLDVAELFVGFRLIGMVPNLEELKELACDYFKSNVVEDFKREFFAVCLQSWLMNSAWSSKVCILHLLPLLHRVLQNFVHIWMNTTDDSSVFTCDLFFIHPSPSLSKPIPLDTLFFARPAR